MPPQTDIDDLIDSFRARARLGSATMSRLFDFLVACAREGRRPKEVEIAAAVFRRGADFDSAQDASVRVGVHRLRRKLEDFYAQTGRADPLRLVIPPGEYRLIVAPNDPRPSAPPEDRRALRLSRKALWLGAAALAAVNLAIWLVVAPLMVPSDIRQARHAQPWSALARSHHPTLIVLGDYYIFGETDEAHGVDRLVREYDVNTRAQLDAWLQDRPDRMERYRDLGLYYLPVGAGLAMRDLAPLVADGRSAGPKVVLASDLTPAMLKTYDIVYVGYVSGLGLLREPVFHGSRYAVGVNYDQLIDRRTQARYASEEGGPERRSQTRDYGLISSFEGPTGNRVLVVAGMRDMGLMQAAETLSDPQAIKRLTEMLNGAGDFEALIEAEGLQRQSLTGRIVQAAPRKAHDWTDAEALKFPAG